MTCAKNEGMSGQTKNKGKSERWLVLISFVRSEPFSFLGYFTNAIQQEISVL